jgi:hypothetical protein
LGARPKTEDPFGDIKSRRDAFEPVDDEMVSVAADLGGNGKQAVAGVRFGRGHRHQCFTAGDAR